MIPRPSAAGNLATASRCEGIADGQRFDDLPIVEILGVEYFRAPADRGFDNKAIPKRKAMSPAARDRIQHELGVRNNYRQIGKVSNSTLRFIDRNRRSKFVSSGHEKFLKNLDANKRFAVLYRLNVKS